MIQEFYELMPNVIDNLISHKDNNKIFISYGWDNDNHKSWVVELANLLNSQGFEILLDQNENTDIVDLFKKAHQCRNILLVTTPRYMNNCLIGRADESDYYNFPSFSYDLEVPKEFVLEIIKEMYALCVLKYGYDNINPITPSLKEFNKTKDLKKRFNYPVYIFEDGWCYQEFQQIILNETRFEKIFTLYRSGNNCFARYPIIDFSLDSKFAESLDTLIHSLKSKEDKYRHVYNDGAFINKDKSTHYLYSLKKSALLMGDHLNKIKLWQRTNEMAHCVLPDFNSDNKIAPIITKGTKWKQI